MYFKNKELLSKINKKIQFDKFSQQRSNRNKLIVISSNKRKDNNVIFSKPADLDNDF